MAAWAGLLVCQWLCETCFWQEGQGKRVEVYMASYVCTAQNIPCLCIQRRATAPVFGLIPRLLYISCLIRNNLFCFSSFLHIVRAVSKRLSTGLRLSKLRCTWKATGHDTGSCWIWFKALSCHNTRCWWKLQTGPWGMTGFHGCLRGSYVNKWANFTDNGRGVLRTFWGIKSYTET